MNRKAQLNACLGELDPELTLESWQATESALAEYASRYLAQSELADFHGKYLAEEIYLDSLKPYGIAEGIERFIRQYTDTRFPDSTDKLEATDRLCSEASLNRVSADSKSLAQLIDHQLKHLPPSPDSGDLSLEQMKGVKAATRFGDIVFLPRNAELIVIGDTHGDLHSVRHIIHDIKASHYIERGFYVVFLGDYVNNGIKSWQTLLELLRFQQQYPEAVVLLNGNHEFHESISTALNEQLNVHWHNLGLAQLPSQLHDRLPQFDNHYGHLRLDLMRSFGFEEGERLYAKWVRLGLQFPFLCISGRLMICHSIGKLDRQPLSLPDLLHCKRDDIENISILGFETWKERTSSLHASIVNNRAITTDIVDAFSSTLDVEQFIVGHCHYRSGDTLALGKNSLTTIISSSPFSPDSGRYMYQQMMVERNKKRPVENLPTSDAVAGYLLLTQGTGKHREHKHSRLIPI